MAAGRNASAAIAVFNGLLVGLLWILVLAQIQTDRDDAIREATNRNDNLAIAFEQYTVRTLESADAILRYLIREFKRSGRKIDLERFVLDYTDESRAVSGVVLADARGDAITSAFSGRPGASANVADREHFSVHVSSDSGQMFVGKPVRGRLSGRPLVPVTRRINNADGSFGGVAMALIEPRRFTDVLQDANLRPLDIISLVGLDGITRARLRGSTASWGEDIGKSPLFAEQARRPTGNLRARGQLDNVPRFFSYRTLHQYGVVIIVGSAEADAMAEFHHRQSQYLWAAGLTSAVIAAFSLLLGCALRNQRLAETEASRAEARYRATFEQAAVGMALVDVLGQYLEVNEKFCEIIGYSRQELLGRRVADVTHPEDVATGNRLRSRLIDDPGAAPSIGRDRRYIRKDGTVIWCSITTSAVRGEDGSTQYVLGVVQDISGRKRDEERIRQLNDRLMAVQETERAALSHELHDEFGQVLTAVQLQLRALARQAPSTRIEDCIALVGQLLNQVRSLSLDLRPPQLEEQGLAVALGSHLERLARLSMRKISFHCATDVPPLRGPPATACFRIAQEAVTNALRHSYAEEINVSLERDGDFLCVVVRDDGIGFDAAQARDLSIRGASAGLLGMENRAASLDGSFEIRSSPGAGTEVRVRTAIAPATGNTG